MEGALQTFLDFARPPRLLRRPLAIQDAVQQILRLVCPRAAGQRVKVETDLPGESVVVEADAGQVRQVLLNLLLNALDALPGGGTVRVQARVDAGGGGRWLVVEVADTGTGLPADLGDRIFEPFVSTRETGAGLGLAICRQIAEAHGGTIEGADRPGGGAVFTVRFPLPQTGTAAAAADLSTEVCGVHSAGGG
jgi:signal transduction histidine kinase